MPIHFVPDDLSFGDIEAILAEIHGIASPKRTAFQARIKNFFRLGFPEYIPRGRGRGRKGRYGAFELAAIAIAVELSQLGLAPTHVQKLMTDHWDTVCNALFITVDSTSASDRWGYELVGQEYPSILMFDPAALWSLMDDVRPSDVDYASASFELLRYGIDAKTILNRTSMSSFRTAIINVTALVERLSLAFSVEGNMRQGFIEELAYRTPRPTA